MKLQVLYNKTYRKSTLQRNEFRKGRSKQIQSEVKEVYMYGTSNHQR